MNTLHHKAALVCIGLLAWLSPAYSLGQSIPSDFTFHTDKLWIIYLLLLLCVVLIIALILNNKASKTRKRYQERLATGKAELLRNYCRTLSSNQLQTILGKNGKHGRALFLFAPSPFLLQIKSGINLLNQSGIIITIVLILIPVLLGVALLLSKTIGIFKRFQNKQNQVDAAALADYLRHLSPEEHDAILRRKTALDYSLTHHELSGTEPPQDDRALLQISPTVGLPIAPIKKKAQPRPNIDPALSKLIIWFLGSATFWLLFGTTVGEYLGIKFVAPDADHLSWLSFGRLRPVHTNAVFWGWASLGMIGLGYYVVPRVSNCKLASLKKGWYTLYLINAAVILGTLSLMAGINNGGGEYREYIWPIMLLFGIGLVLTLINFLQTIAHRTTKEIYIANWYMVAAIIFTLVIALVAYIPFWQNGLGETIVQGYYMHQGVGMWFMLFTLGLVYYFLPQQLNKPIYSYSLGILAFWTQILFYTLIGSHHFVFSSIPWWLQTIAIVGSAGMAIPVIAGTTNFLMTFRGAWHKVNNSYTLPFFLVGIIFYFTGSMQGTAEAFRFTNQLWHFTDFTVAHSHLTMYGIISFFLWACIYAIIPRLTGKEPPQITVGAHFWLALLGLLFYTVPLMYGSTLRGLLWIDGKPFLESVTFMAPFWLWRAIGGSLMWLSHLFFAYNIYRMLRNEQIIDVNEYAIGLLEKDNNSNQQQ